MKTLQQAVEDPKIPSNSLAILTYMTDNPNTTMHKVLERFKKQRGWWTRHLKPLKDNNYITYLKLKDGHNEQWVHEYFVENKQKQIEEVVTQTVTEIPAGMKWVDPLTASQEDYDITAFYLEYKFPAPKSQHEIQEAKQPGMKLWARVTRNYVGWGNAEQINEILNDNPNQKALAIAWKEWKFSGYRTSNVRGILDWYSLLAQDIKAQPWSNKQRSNGNGNGTTKQRGSTIRKEHGNSSVKYNQDDFTSITFDTNSP